MGKEEEGKGKETYSSFCGMHSSGTNTKIGPLIEQRKNVWDGGKLQKKNEGKNGKCKREKKKER